MEPKQELFLFLAVRLRARSTELPAPRVISRDPIEAWIADDNGADFRPVSGSLQVRDYGRILP